MWRLDFSVGVDKDLAFVAKLPPALARREQTRAVSAPLEHILAILEQYLEFLHEDLALQLVFLVLQAVQGFNLHFASETFHKT